MYRIPYLFILLIFLSNCGKEQFNFNMFFNSIKTEHLENKYNGFSYYEIRKNIYKVRYPGDTTILFMLKGDQIIIKSIYSNSEFLADSLKLNKSILYKIGSFKHEMDSFYISSLMSNKDRFELCFNAKYFDVKSIPEYPFNNGKFMCCLCKIKDVNINDDKAKVFLKNHNPIYLNDGWYFYKSEIPELH